MKTRLADRLIENLTDLRDALRHGRKIKAETWAKCDKCRGTAPHQATARRVVRGLPIEGAAMKAKRMKPVDGIYWTAMQGQYCICCIGPQRKYVKMWIANTSKDGRWKPEDFRIARVRVTEIVRKAVRK